MSHCNQKRWPLKGLFFSKVGNHFGGFERKINQKNPTLYNSCYFNVLVCLTWFQVHGRDWKGTARKMGSHSLWLYLSTLSRNNSLRRAQWASGAASRGLGSCSGWKETVNVGFHFHSYSVLVSERAPGSALELQWGQRDRKALEKWSGAELCASRGCVQRSVCPDVRFRWVW